MTVLCLEHIFNEIVTMITSKPMILYATKDKILLIFINLIFYHLMLPKLLGYNTHRIPQSTILTKYFFINVLTTYYGNSKDKSGKTPKIMVGKRRYPLFLIFNLLWLYFTFYINKRKAKEISPIFMRTRFES